MAEHLAKVLEKLAQEGKLQSALTALESTATQKQPQTSSQRYKSVSELVKHYQEKQADDRRTKSQSKVGTQSKQESSVKETPPKKSFSLSFAKYRKSGRFSYKMMPPGKVQVPGFCNTDKHRDVIMKGASGLGIDASPDQLSLIVSNALIRDAPLPSGQQWTLGNYIDEFGGVQARGKRTFGILVPIDVEEEEEVQSKSGDGQYLQGQSSIPVRRRSSPSTKICTVAAKRLKGLEPTSTLGTIADPINLDSDSDEPFESEIEESTTFGMYSPVSSGKVFPSITANGVEGVWRLLRFEYYSPHEKVMKEMEDDVCTLQPESEGFVLVESVECII